MNEIIKSLYERKSMRVYEDRPIPEEMKQVILEAAAQAPTAGCQQLTAAGICISGSNACVWMADGAAEATTETTACRSEVYCT